MTVRFMDHQGPMYTWEGVDWEEITYDYKLLCEYGLKVLVVVVWGGGNQPGHVRRMDGKTKRF